MGTLMTWEYTFENDLVNEGICGLMNSLLVGGHIAQKVIDRL